jgi:hypothetical protein
MLHVKSLGYSYNYEHYLVLAILLNIGLYLDRLIQL